MPNLYNVMNNPRWVYWKDMWKDWNDTKNQSYGYNQKVFVELYLIRCLKKLYFRIAFWIVLGMIKKVSQGENICLT